jgi:CRP/FNR family transcriptional regulator, cyclic AMP receptor protein
MVSLDLLRRFPFFSFMDDKELKAVSQIVQEMHLQIGDVLTEANRPAEALYFLIKGHIPYYMVVTSEHMPDYRQEYFIGYINPEEIVGISALIEPYQYTATLRADEPVQVIKINASALRALCEVDSHLSIGLMKAIAKAAMERLQMTRVQLVAEMLETHNKPVS